MHYDGPPHRRSVGLSAVPLTPRFTRLPIPTSHPPTPFVLLHPIPPSLRPSVSPSLPPSLPPSLRASLLPSFTKDFGQWVNLWADNFSKAEYIMQLDSDTVFNFPVTRQTFFDSDGRPFLPFWSEISSPWTNLSSALFGHPEMQFMAYFPAVTTPEALKTVRRAVAKHFNMPFNQALGQPKHFSQFDLIGHAMVSLGYPARPCRPSNQMTPTDWCAHRPSPVAHVPYLDKCIIEAIPECFIANKKVHPCAPPDLGPEECFIRASRLSCGTTGVQSSAMSLCDLLVGQGHLKARGSRLGRTWVRPWRCLWKEC